MTKTDWPAPVEQAETVMLRALRQHPGPLQSAELMREAVSAGISRYAAAGAFQRLLKRGEIRESYSLSSGVSYFILNR